MKPLVSIIIPCYNSERWLSQSVNSALSQTWENIEVIIVNDGSTDNSLAIAQHFESSLVKIINQQNQGASVARNRALREVQGDFIQFLDADDLLAPDKIERQIKLIEQGYVDYIIAGEWGRFYTSHLMADFIREAVWQDMSPVDWLVCSWEGGGMMHPGAWLVPHNIAQNAGTWNENLTLNDDGEYFCRVVLASKGVKFCHGARSFYRSNNPNSLSKSNSHTAIKSLFQSLELGTNNLLAKENSLKTRKACANLFQRFIYEFYPDNYSLLIKANDKIIDWGGSDTIPDGSSLFKFMKRLVGWKLAKRFQKMKRKIFN